MMSQTMRSRRRGSILPLAAVGLVALCGFVALAVDVGMVAIAKDQCQNAADVAAVAGARTIDGSASSNLTAATTNAQNAATANAVLSSPVLAAEVTIQHGSYHYDTTSQTFYPQYPPVAPDTYNLTNVSITHPIGTAFAQVLGITSSSVTAKATAAHRPRDVSIVLDYSGSMNDESDLWNDVYGGSNNDTFLGTLNYSTNNADSVFPQFGAYSATGSATLQCTSADPRVGLCNVSQSTLGIPALVNDLYQNNFGAAPAQAFTAAPSSYANPPTPTSANPASGDYYLKKNNTAGNPFAVTVADLNGGSLVKNTSFEATGYTYYYGKNTTGNTFRGYIQGPGYWGDTFFIWPPDPLATNDWRQKFFGTKDNTKLWDASGNWLTPSGNYTINYKAILAWIKAPGTGATSVFPSQLRAGHILYYSAIPTDVPAAAYDHTQPNSAITDPDQRFWKEYIDYVIGVWRDPFGTIALPGQYPACSYGPDFTWGTVQISAPPTNGTYMNYTDNPLRPRHRFWFGPMTLVQFLSDTGKMPGTAHDISMYPAKLGIAGALQDIQNNHPNDLVSMILFSRPQFANDPPGVGAFNQVQYSLSRNYSAMINSLWLPPNSGTSDVRLWDANGLQVPHAGGDYTYNTTTVHGFMLAYNQFSGSSQLRAQAVGGLGRKGAQRMVILETDGMANVDSVPAGGFTNAGPTGSYYNILPGQTVNGGNYNQQSLLQAVQAICNTSTGLAGTTPGYSPNPGYPGFATAQKPVIIHTLGFGAIFEPTASGTEQGNAVALLQQISQIGGTTFPGSSTDPTNGYKWVIGTLAQRTANMRQAFSKIMASNGGVTLVQ